MSRRDGLVAGITSTLLSPGDFLKHEKKPKLSNYYLFLNKSNFQAIGLIVLTERDLW